MTIYFNTEWDGGPWSDGVATLGTIRTGPLGLLSILENRCGTSAKGTSHAVRVASMVKLLSARTGGASRRYGAPRQWFSASFNADPWATAAELLSYRDELLAARIAGGDIEHQSVDSRQADSGLSARLTALTDLVNDSEVPRGGISDRIRDVLLTVRSPAFSELRPLAGYRIVVQEPASLVPPVWRTVLEAVTDAGATVEYPFTSSSDNLAGVTGRAVTVVKASDQWQAAEHLAALLTRVEETSCLEPQRLALVVSGDSGVLDRTLKRWNLPTTGSSEESAARWGLQILPAFLATLWRPADPHAIATFLSLASDLVPGVVTGQLIRALSEHPGTGGPRWTNAIDRIAQAMDAETADFYDRIFARELYDPEPGVPIPALRERLTWLNSRLGARISQRETVRYALGHIAELRDTIRNLSAGDAFGVPWSLLHRIVGTVVRPLAVGSREEAAPWSVHRSVATVPSSARTVIFWNCVEEEPSLTRRYTDAEREVLKEAGYVLEAPETVRFREEWNRLNSFSVPERHIVAFVPDRIQGEAVEPVRWLNDLEQACRESYREVDLSSNRTELDIAGVSIPRSGPAPVLPPEPLSRLGVPPGTINYPETLSYSAVSSLIGCPMQWTIGRIGALSAASNVSLPAGNQMVGTLTHAIIEKMAREHARDGILPEDAGALAAALFDELVPAMAAELLQPGRSLARRRYKDTVVSAVTMLREELLRLDLRIRQVETFLEAPWDLPLESEGTTITVRFRGPADMELVDDAGNPFVLDLKYSYAEKFYTDLVSRGEALQLASYAWLIERNRGRKTVGSGYYLLPRRKLITDSSRAGSAAVESARSLTEIWQRGERSTSRALRRLHTDGIVDVTGLQDEESRETEDGSDRLYVEPPCQFCDYQIICGYGRGQVS